VSRALMCGRCRSSVEVFEAVQGAKTAAEHLFIDPSSFVCGGCLERSGEAVTGALSAATVAAGGVERHSRGEAVALQGGGCCPPGRGRGVGC
jgi:hypothetical protein